MVLFNFYGRTIDVVFTSYNQFLEISFLKKKKKILEISYKKINFFLYFS